MKTFKSYISEARIYEPKYKAGYEFTLNERTPNAVHRALGNYIPGDPFKKSDKEPTIEINTQENPAWVAIVLEDKTGQIIRVWGSESALNNAFNKGSSATGGKMFAADWEEVITIAHNMKSTEASGPKMDEAAKLGGIKLPIKKKIVDKVNTPQLASGMLAGVNLPSNKPMIHFGRKTGSPSKLWSDTFEEIGIAMNPKSMTPKTDMKVGDMHISLKKAGGSQLMSGYKGDTLGVIMAAYNKAMKEKAGSNADIQRLEAGLKGMRGAVISNFQATQDVAGGSRDIRAKVKAGGTLDKIERAAWKTIQDGDTAQGIIRSILDTSPRVKHFAVEEAMTGNMKFSDSDPRSNYLMVFNPDPVPATAHMDVIGDKIIKEYAGKVTWSVGLKSSKRRGALSLRAIIADEYEPTSTMKQIISEAWDEIGEDRIYLAEGWWSKAKDKASSVVDWAKTKGLKVLEMLWNKIVSKIIALLVKGWVWVQRIFGWQPVLQSISNPYFV
jgi:hypothetical protein